jgi:hypothetical protein
MLMKRGEGGGALTDHAHLTKQQKYRNLLRARLLPRTLLWEPKCQSRAAFEPWTCRIQLRENYLQSAVATPKLVATALLKLARAVEYTSYPVVLKLAALKFYSARYL